MKDYSDLAQRHDEVRKVLRVFAPRIDMTGKRYGRLVALYPVSRTTGRPGKYWQVRCDCGKERAVNGADIRTGDTRSCGCLDREKRAQRAGDRTRTHGLSGTTTHNIWDSMVQRCVNPNRKDYPRYGGRGITVCAHWLTFENFLADMGERPKGLTLDRRNNALGYSPENCRWATTKQQARNHSGNRVITLQGISRCLVEWGEVLGIALATVRGRLSRGWSEERALTQPIDARFHRK